MAVKGDGFGLRCQQHGQQGFLRHYALTGALADQPLLPQLQG